MTFIILYEVYHDNGTVDPHVFTSLDDARAYVQALDFDDSVLPGGATSDISADIYAVSSAGLRLVEQWYQINSW